MASFDTLDPSSPHFEAAVSLSAERSPATGGDPEEVRESFERDADRPAYRSLVAVEDDAVLGVAYGYRSEPGQFVHTRLRESMSHTAADRWLSDCFEVAEFGVTEAARDRGLAGRLHDELLSDVDAATALLLVRDDAGARPFRRSEDWHEVDELTLGGDTYPVLGRDL